MCGVVGIVNLDGSLVKLEILKRMTDAVGHRGPDGEGHWLSENVGIGHRRLAVIDLSDFGQQPMVDSQNRYVLSYNGEIYNYREIRKELESLGYKFRSATDSEVVLNALVEWGTGALRKFNGMFALALWDSWSKSLILARDRYGVKPLYYCVQGNRFSFGSEQKAIDRHPDFAKRVNLPGLFEYLTFQNFYTDQTLLQDVQMLKAGHFMELRVDALGRYQSKQVQYWNYDFRDPGKVGDVREHVEELDRLFVEAVNRQLVSDVKVGSYLSGGVDSGSIAAVAASSVPDLETFTVGFDTTLSSGRERLFDEREPARSLAKRLAVKHHDRLVGPSDMEKCMPSLTRHLEEPRVGQSYPNYFAAELASERVKVVLSGTGGDELFGGYPWRYARIADVSDFDSFVDNYHEYWNRLLGSDEKKALFSPIWNDVREVSTRDIFKSVFEGIDTSRSRPADFLNYAFHFEAKTFLHGLFVVEDKLSMAFGLESRVPFMDNDLVDFAMGCPVELKTPGFSEFSERGSVSSGSGKIILRKMMERHVPQEVAGTVKQGFSAPDAGWFSGESADFVSRSLWGSQTVLGGLLDADSIKALVESHSAQENNRRLLVWSLLSLEYWLRENF